MADYLIRGESIEVIADEVRTLKGTTNLMSLAAMKSSLSEANAEIDNQADLIAQIRAVAEGLPEPPSAVGMANLSENTTSLQEVLEILQTKDEPTLILQNKTVTPTTEAKTVVADYGYDGLGKVTVRGVENAVGENIKSGVTIAGVEGTFTSDATATAAHILEGESAYVNGKLVEGAIPILEAVDNGAYGVATVTYNGSRIGLRSTIRLDSDAGYISSTTPVTVYAHPEQFGNATAADVALGKTFTSVNGCKIKGTNEGLLPAPVVMNGNYTFNKTLDFSTILSAYLNCDHCMQFSINGVQFIGFYFSWISASNIQLKAKKHADSEYITLYNNGVWLDDSYRDISFTSPSVASDWFGSNTVSGARISFTIGSYVYQAIEGMTWGEWCESEYNTDGYHVADDGIYSSENEYYVAYLANDDSVYAGEEIHDGVRYYESSSSD